MIVDPFGPLIYFSEISEEFLIYLKNVSKRSQNAQDVGFNLAGNINDQKIANAKPKQFLEHIDSHVKDYLLGNFDRAQKYVQDYKKPTLNNISFDLGAGPWINYQKKHEFNPIHKHSGDLSSVIFIDIPEEIEKESKQWEGKTNCPSPGMLEFVYSTHTFMCSNSHKVVPKTGQIYIFPAELKHCVYPFTSDVTRVTMSFNIHNLQFD